MAALLLSAGGAALGGALFGPIGAIAGRIVGAIGGNMLDRALFGGATERQVTGPRLSSLDVMTSSEGAPVPRVYGRARLAGQVIWATSLEEVVTNRVETAGGKGLGTGSTTTETTYSYYANFAVGLCEGPVARIGRIWADGKLLDQTGVTLRFHSGTEDQAADPLIVAKEGASGTPAYRGLAYVVFERLPLADFGNRLPQLSFEIVNPVGDLERMVRAVALIPGATEFGYALDTVTRQTGPGQYALENRHTSLASSDVVAALDELQALCPALERVSLVVAWFGTDLRAASCDILPGVDSRDKVTTGAAWSVAGVQRADAWPVSQIDGRAAYGGTPSDASVSALIAHLRARGLKVTLYPFVMMDVPPGNARPDPWSGAAAQPAYPWRGRITCDPAPGRAGSPDGSAAAATQVSAFFNGANRYRAMILHYAQLAADAGGVDGFLIGSELGGLTRLRSASGVYPAVTALAALAADVRAILGAGAKISYGADWTEYGSHVLDGAQEVRFPLDALWASPAIDAVGIDYYAPLSDWRGTANEADRALTDDIASVDYLAGNLSRGEAYDFYYASDAARAAQIRQPITDGLGKPWIYRAKDLWAWWSQPHVERVGGAELAAPTAWVPRSKPIWLTEIGVPAVDKGSNQPSVFPDAKSSAAGLPYFSTGARDEVIQRAALEAMLRRFDPAFGASLADNPVSPVYGARMIDVSATALWCWDARPFPAFPAAEDVWGDSANWYTGHWLTGRLGGVPLAALVRRLASDCGVATVDASALRGFADGYVIDRPMSLRAMIEPLAQVFQFGAVDAAGTLVFRMRGGTTAAEFTEDDFAETRGAAHLRLTRAEDSGLPRAVLLTVSDPARDYRRAVAASRRLAGHASGASYNDQALVMQASAAQQRADVMLQDVWAGREDAAFALPPSALALSAGDVVGVTANGVRRLIEITETVDAETRQIKGRSIDPDVFADAPQPLRPFVAPALPRADGPALAQLVDLPMLDDTTPEILTRLAVFADPWPGAFTVWRSRSGESFTRLATLAAPCVMGETLTALPAGPLARWDRQTGLRVRLYGGALASLSLRRVLDGGNAAALGRGDGSWEIVQFANATLVAPGEWQLAMLLRGQAGSESAMGAPLAAGAPFVLLDSHLAAVARGADELERAATLRIVPAGRDAADPSGVELTLTPSATALRPLAPVHLRARRDASGVTLSWVRRTRISGDNWAGEVPLGEASEAYAVDILSGASVIRSLTSATPWALYAAADELADFGAAQTTLSVRVAQLSARAGAGFAATATLPVLS